MFYLLNGVKTSNEAIDNFLPFVKKRENIKVPEVFAKTHIFKLKYLKLQIIFKVSPLQEAQRIEQG